MFKVRVNQIIIHPAFISLIVYAVVLLFVHPSFSKYRIIPIRDEYTGDRSRYFYVDLDGDQISERIWIDNNDSLQTKVQILKENMVHDQYNLKYQPGYRNFLFPGDINHDGNKELFVFTVSSDSVFLNVIDPVTSRRVLINARFIDFRRKAPHSTDAPVITPVGLFKKKDNQTADFIFIINTGYSRQPRNIYSYSLPDDSLIRSPESCAGIIDCYALSLKDDEQSIFVLSTTAPGNFEKDAPFSDQYVWLMVLDRNLNFLFPPVMIGEYPSKLHVIPVKSGNQTRLVLFYDYAGTGEQQSSLSVYDLKGNKLFSKPITGDERMHGYLLPHEDGPGSGFYFIRNRETLAEEMDSNFRVIHTINLPPVDHSVPFAHLDADGDNREEYFFLGRGFESMVVTQEDLSHAVVYSFKMVSGPPMITQVLQPGKEPWLYLQFGDYGSFVQFGLNPVYYLKYPFYVCLYLALWGFIMLLAGIQRYRLNLKQETGREMASLQLKAIKNQLDPHFTLNILNSIGSLYAVEGNREEADYIFGKYARLVRQTVIASDNIIITLAEELDFVKNYIDLERFRSNNSFDFMLDIAQDVDLQTRIPKMLIHTIVENAIKHGVRNTAAGMLRINIIKVENKLQIAIEDNGPGMQSMAVSSGTGTGKGLKIMQELTDYFYKLEKVRITFNLNNITGDTGTITGTRAVIRL